MSSAIIMNLAALAVVVGGWTAAARVFYTHLSDPYAKPRASRQPAAQGADAAPRPAPAGTPAAPPDRRR